MHQFFWLGLMFWVIAALAWSVEEALGYVSQNDQKAMRYYRVIPLLANLQLALEIVLNGLRFYVTRYLTWHPFLLLPTLFFIYRAPEVERWDRVTYFAGAALLLSVGALLL